ncbi:polyketide synthase dehydratase domain-containing protein, partial [Dactylosporangium sucinum]|uniref:polyketide synthase dehydratase domain-containing protein n=1 Tax=Dactylosporangium sucinum TaxID=1424081 RepID=UPI00167CE915
AVQLQLVVGPAGPDGTHELGMHARPEGEEAWTRHASGLLDAGEPAAPGDLASWPPAGASAVPIDGLYERLADAGVVYDPVYHGLRQVWRRDGAVFAEVALPDGVAAQGAAYALHPVLLDAALQAWLAPGLGPVADRPDAPARMPFTWSGVTVHRGGADRLRVRITAAGDDGVAVEAADETGTPVLSVAAMVLRPVPTGQLRVADRSLFRVAWSPWTGIGGSAG